MVWSCPSGWSFRNRNESRRCWRCHASNSWMMIPPTTNTGLPPCVPDSSTKHRYTSPSYAFVPRQRRGTFCFVGRGASSRNRISCGPLRQEHLTLESAYKPPIQSASKNSEAGPLIGLRADRPRRTRRAPCKPAVPETPPTAPKQSQSDAQTSSPESPSAATKPTPGRQSHRARTSRDCRPLSAAGYWPQTRRLDCLGLFGGNLDLGSRGLADSVGGLYREMASREELATVPGRMMPPAGN